MTERYKRALVDTMVGLSRETFACIHARVFSGLSLRDASVITGLPEDEIDRRVGEGLTLCREALDEQEIPAMEGWDTKKVKLDGETERVFTQARV